MFKRKVIKEDKNFYYCLQRKRNFYLFQNLVYPFLDNYYKILLRFIALFSKKRKVPYKYDVSLVLIFKNESFFLEEWLCHHLNLGIEHFYLYNNNSIDDYDMILSSYIHKGCVTLIHWPEYPGQYSAYKHWYDNYRFDSRWVSFLDIDEFLCPIKEKKIYSLLKQYEIYPVILVYWKLFGTSGLMKHDYSRLVTEQYTICSDKLFTEGKIFYNTRFDVAEYPISMHGFYTRWKFFKIPPCNIFKKMVIWNIHRIGNCVKIPMQVNHYWSKSFCSWRDKYKKGSIEKGVKWKNFTFFDQLEKKCISSDYSIFRFIIDIKLRMIKENKNVR